MPAPLDGEFAGVRQWTPPPIVVGTSFGSFAPAHRARSHSLRCASSPHRAGRGGDPAFVLPKRETGCGRSKEKKRFAALRCGSPPRGRGSPESVLTKPAGPLPARAGPLIFPGLIPRVRCGGKPGWSTHGPCFCSRCRSRSREGRPAPSEAEGAEIEERQMRFCTPGLCRYPAAETGEQV